MPSQDNENAMDGLLRRSLARDSAAAGDCPDAELLAAYFDQSLGADEAAGYELHFSTCASLPRTTRRDGARKCRPSSFMPPDLALEPALAGARPVPAIALGAARIPAQAKPAASGARSETKFPERKSPDARWLDLRWLIPVAAMLVLGTFVFMRSLRDETTVGCIVRSRCPNQLRRRKTRPLLEPEKKASDAATPEKAAPKAQPSATSTPSRSRSSIASARGAVANPQGNEGSARPQALRRLQEMLPPRLRDRRKQLAVGASSFQSNKQVAGAISMRNGSGIPECRIRTRPGCSGSGVECVNGKNSGRRGLGRRCEISRARAASERCNKNTRFRTRRPEYQ